MNKILLSLLIIIFIFFTILFVKNVEARSGCCSYHDGVCGCSCCDGTPLSATCSQYYPQCYTPVFKPIQKPILPTYILQEVKIIEKEEVEMTEKVTEENEEMDKITEKVTEENENSNSFYGLMLITIGGLIIIGWHIIVMKRIRK